MTDPIDLKAYTGPDARPITEYLDRVIELEQAAEQPDSCKIALLKHFKVEYEKGPNLTACLVNVVHTPVSYTHLTLPTTPYV